MRDKPWFAVVYMFVITAFFSSVLIGFARTTRHRVDANERLAFETAVLAVLPIELSADASNLELHEAFVGQVTPPNADSGGAYLLIKNDEIAGFALPVAGQGFWAPIAGVIGIKPDRRTITGIAFYEQKETPGLGAEIIQPAFCDQFIGKRIATTGLPIAIRPLGSQLGENEVQAVTGATQTCSRLEILINAGISRWREALAEPGEEMP